MAVDAKLRLTAQDKTARAFRSVQSNLGAVSSKLLGVHARIGALIGVTGFGALVKQSLTFADTLGKTADKLGITTTALQELRFAAELTGVPVTALDVGIQRFTRRLGEAAEGSGVLAPVLEDLNIELRNTEGTMRSTEAVLGDYADAIKNAESPQQQLLLAFKAFDTEGAAMVNTLRGGREELDKLRTQARQAGAVIGSSLVETATTINDRWTVLNDIIGTKFKSAAISAADAALNLFGIFNNLGDVQGRLLEVNDKILEAEIRLDNARGRNRQGTALRLEQLREERAELQALEETMVRARMAREAMSAGALMPGGGDQEDRPNTFTGLTTGQMEDDFAIAVSMNDEMVAIFRKNAQQRAQAEQNVSQAISNARMNTFGQGVALLQAFAGKSKTAAIAAIAVQKGLAIAQTVMNTNVAAMRALAELGPIAGPPAAATIKAWGAASIALIAATGLAQASQVGASAGGGAALGTPGNPVTTSPEIQPATTTTEGTTGTINIYVNGVLTPEIVDGTLVPLIKDGLDNRDVILFNNNSAQAQELFAV